MEEGAWAAKALTDVGRRRLIQGRILVLFTVLLSSSHGQQDQLQTSGPVCSVGQSGPYGKLSSLTAQQLAEGALASTRLNSWDFGAQQGSLQAVPGQNVTLACILALNAAVSVPSKSAVFLQPLAVDVRGAAGLNMAHVTLNTTCSTVLSYQSHFCSSFNVAGSLTLRPGAVHFAIWSDGFTTLHNVTLTCTLGAAGGGGATAAGPQLPCWLAAVQSAEELLAAFLALPQPGGPAANANIVVAADIIITNSSWPDAAVPVRAGVQLVGSSRLARPVLDFQLMTALWELHPAATVSLINLTLVNLAPTYMSPASERSVFAILTERIWAFRRSDLQLHVYSSTLVVPSEEFRYMKHWLTYLSSPVPEDKAKAAWMNVIEIKVRQVNESGVYYNSVQSFTATYDDVRVTDTLPGHALLPIETGLQQALGREDNDVPLTAVRQVINASDMLIALEPTIMQPDSEGRRWLLLIANFSLSDLFSPSAATPVGSSDAAVAAAAAGAAVQLPNNSMVVAVGIGLRSVRLDLGRRPAAVAMGPESKLLLRDLTLDGLAARAAAYDSGSPLDSLATPLWGLALSDPAYAVGLENCSLLISASELRLLQQCLLPPGSGLPPLPPAAADSGGGEPAYHGALIAAVRGFFTSSRVASYNTPYLRLGWGATERYGLTNLTFRAPVAEDGEGNPPEVVSPAALPNPGRGGLEGWEVGIIVGCVVGGALALMAAAVGLLYMKRRRQYRGVGGSESDAALGSEGAYDKYGGTAPGGSPRGPAGSGGGVGSSDLVNASHELTNSSQVLRPDARRSDLGAAAAAIARSKAGSRTASGSASGTIGQPGRSPSITGIAIQEISGGGSGSGVRAAAAALPPAGPPSALSAAATAAAALAAAHDGHPSQFTDSFERPPSNTGLGQHGPAGRQPAAAQRVSSAGAPASSTSGPPHPSTSTSTSAAVVTQSLLTTTGGGGSLEQMHAMIQVLGRDFNDRQLEVHELLGKGAHGTVYRGTWRGLPVAVKSMVFTNDSGARQQSRALMEAAISANLAHPNIVTTYSYELREVEHELASISPELARQGGGWRLLIIQEFCDAGPLRRLVDCGFFLAPPKSSGTRPKRKLPTIGLKWKDSPSGGDGSSGSSNGSGSRDSPRHESPAVAASQPSSPPPPASPGGGPRAGPSGGGGHGQTGHPHHHQHWLSHPHPKTALEPLPADVPDRPTSWLQAARRYVEAALEVARGLQHIHDKNIVHGDLNPNNVLLVRAPGSPLGFCLKVADFGLSVRMAEGDSHMSNLFQGSPYYCAPEVVLSGKVGKSADIYSLGIMLWELQSGVRPLWRAGVRLRSYPSLNTAELEFGPDTPAAYVRLARECFHGSKDARPRISAVTETLAAIKADLDAN